MEPEYIRTKLGASLVASRSQRLPGTGTGGNSGEDLWPPQCCCRALLSSRCCRRHRVHTRYPFPQMLPDTLMRLSKQVGQQPPLHCPPLHPHPTDPARVLQALLGAAHGAGPPQLPRAGGDDGRDCRQGALVWRCALVWRWGRAALSPGCDWAQSSRDAAASWPAGRAGSRLGQAVQRPATLPLCQPLLQTVGSRLLEEKACKASSPMPIL